MISGIFLSLTLLLLVCIFYVADFWLMRRFDPRRASGSSRSWNYTLLAWLAAACVIIQPWLMPRLGLRTGQPWGLAIQLVGLLLAIAALLLHWWARLSLGPYYGEREELQEGQALVVNGPYGSIRHPIYLSYFLFTIGLLLVNPALLTLLGVLYAFWDFPRAAHREEKLLAEHLEGYAEYMGRTGRFLPRLK